MTPTIVYNHYSSEGTCKHPQVVATSLFCVLLIITLHMFLLQRYVADKIHCVWLADGEMNVLFECKDFQGPDHLGAAPVELISNKELVQKYLDETEYIPHIQRVVTLESTSQLHSKN